MITRKPALTLFSLIVAFSFAVSPASAGETGEGTGISEPTIQFKDTVWDFGKIKEGVINKDFTFRNTGTAVLRITNTRTSCSCTTVGDYSKETRPGEEGKIAVFFNADGRFGWHEKTVFVSSNDPKNAVIELTVKGIINARVRIDPASLFFTEADKHGESASVVKLTAEGDKALEILKVVSSSRYFRSSLTKLKENEYELKTEMDPDIPAGFYDEKINIDTGFPDETRITIPIGAVIKERVEVFPPRLLFNTDDKGKATPRFITVSANPHGINVLAVKSNLSFVSTRIIQAKEAGQDQIEVTLGTEAPAGKFDGEITIITDDPDRKEIRIPVSGEMEASGVPSKPGVGSDNASPSKDRLQLAFFYSKDCDDCKFVKESIFPQLEKKYQDRFAVVYFEVGDIKNYQKLIEYEEKSGDTDNEIPVIFLNGKAFSGRKEIEEGLMGAVESSLAIETVEGQPGRNIPEATTDLATSEEKRCYLAYFYKRGCRECRRVEYTLRYLKNNYPELLIREFDIALPESGVINEAVCEVYKVPAGKRMTAPAVFIGQDYLVGDGVKDSEIRKLVEKYRRVGTDIPWDIDAAEKGKAENNIINRFKGLTLPTVIIAAFLDGINPCAFVTMIFFVSYLTFLGRKGREILLVGMTFTLGVFITYTLVGLSLLKFIQGLSFLPMVARVVYVITAGFAFLFGCLSISDYFKWKKNSTAEMSLKLPDSLRKRINLIISRNFRLRNYLLGALIMGFLVSLLELACTGQVYLPTIIFVNQVSKFNLTALIYLVVYNVVFILPLMIVFTLVYFGATSRNLTMFMQKHLGTVKIMTSVLFFALGCVLLIFSR